MYNLGQYLGENDVTVSTVQIAGTWCDAAPNATTNPRLPQLFFRIDAVAAILPEAFDFTDNFASANGTYTLTETPVAITPEPGSLALMLIGIAALRFFAKRKRAAYRSA